MADGENCLGKYCNVCFSFIISSCGKNKIFDCKGVDSYTNGRNVMI